MLVYTKTFGQNDMPTLVEYIKEYRSQGRSDEEIRRLFIEEYGDDPAAVDAAFAQLAAEAAQNGNGKPAGNGKTGKSWFWPVAVGVGALGIIGVVWAVRS